MGSWASSCSVKTQKGNLCSSSQPPSIWITPKLCSCLSETTASSWFLSPFGGLTKFQDASNQVLSSLSTWHEEPSRLPTFPFPVPLYSGILQNIMAVWQGWPALAGHSISLSDLTVLSLTLKMDSSAAIHFWDTFTLELTRSLPAPMMEITQLHYLAWRPRCSLHDDQRELLSSLSKPLKAPDHS